MATVLRCVLCCSSTRIQEYARFGEVSSPPPPALNVLIAVILGANPVDDSCVQLLGNHGLLDKREGHQLFQHAARDSNVPVHVE
jgi:hypothetical protein